jgi:hypothetical protein
MEQCPEALAEAPLTDQKKIALLATDDDLVLSTLSRSLPKHSPRVRSRQQMIASNAASARSSTTPGSAGGIPGQITEQRGPAA